MVLEEDTWTRLRLTDLEEKVLTYCDGNRSVSVIADAIDASRTSEVLRAMRRFFERGAVELR